MLVVHPDSSCDICLEPYTPTRIPHAIACGHIFCTFCLERCNPHICPICRKKYQLDRVKKLHVEAAPSASQGNAMQTGFVEHLQMVAMVSGEEATEEQVELVVTRVNDWIKTLPAQHTYIRPLRLALESVLKGRETREDLKDALDQRHSVERRLDRLEEDLRTARLVEESLLAQNDETKRELDTLQLKYDHMLREDASSTHSRSSAGSIAETRSNKSDDSKKRVSVDGAYSITPGAPHAERVLPPPQKKLPNSTATSVSGHRRGDRGKRPEGPVPAPQLGLGLFTDIVVESNGAGLRVEDMASAMNRGSAEDADRPWNGMGNALGMRMDEPQGSGHHGRSEDWGRPHSHTGSTEGVQRSASMARNASSDSSLANLSILSPPDSSRTIDQRNHHGLAALLHGSNTAIDVSTPQSTTSWGTTTLSSHSSRSTLSVGDMELNGLPALPSGSSLNLGLTGLDDFETVGDDSDEDVEDEVMTPGAGRHVDLGGLTVPFTSRFAETSEVPDRRPGQLRHASMPDRSRAGMTPRVLTRSVSDTTHLVPIGSRPMESDSEEEELEFATMRFSQSFSEVEPALSGLGSNTSGSTSFDNPLSSERTHRRRASSSAAVRLAPLDVGVINHDLGGPLSAHAQYGRSVTFSTPRPDTSRSQPAALPQNSSRSQGIGLGLYTSLVQTGHGKRPQTPKTVPATPYVSTTRVVASSSGASSTSHSMHRGAATVSAPTRPLPSASYDPTYTNVMPSNGHSLPPSHYTTPRTFQHNGSADIGANSGAQQPSYTLQPVVVTGPSESSTQPRSTTDPTRLPVLHAPQPVSGKSHIGRPWRDWAR